MRVILESAREFQTPNKDVRSVPPNFFTGMMMISNSFVGGVYYWSKVIIKSVILGYMFGSGIRLSGPIFPAQILDPTSRNPERRGPRAFRLWHADKLARHLSVWSGIPRIWHGVCHWFRQSMRLCGRKCDMFNLGAARPREPMNSRFFSGLVNRQDSESWQVCDRVLARKRAMTRKEGRQAGTKERRQDMLLHKMEILSPGR